MAWWEYIPVVSTIGHAVADPAGRKITDYESCKTTPEDCENQTPPVAVLTCQHCVTIKLSKYASDWMGTSLGADFFEGVIGATVSQIGAKLIKSAGGRFLGLSGAAWTGVGTALAADALADFAIQIKKLLDMWDASKKAKDQYCTCAEN